MKDREIHVSFNIDQWYGNWEELGDAIDYFAEFFGVELTSIGMAGHIPVEGS